MVQTLEGHSDEVTAVLISPSGKELYTGSEDGTVRAWDLATGDANWQVKLSVGVLDVALSTETNQLAAIVGMGMIKVWDADKGRELARLDVPSLRESKLNRTDFRLPTSIDMSPDGGLIALGFNDGNILIWDGRPLTELSRTERDASALLTYHFGKYSNSDIAQQIRDDPTVSDSTSERALQFLDAIGESKSVLLHTSASKE